MSDNYIDHKLLKQPEFHQALMAIAGEAGDVIMNIYDCDDLCIKMKSDNTPVTLADLAANRVIEEKLSRLTPTVPIISEENLSQYKSLNYHCAYWLVDPLDGTREFIEKNGEFTVNIALIIDGDPVFGVVYVPVNNTFYWGGDGIGAWRQLAGNITRIRVSTCNMPPRIVVSPHYMNDETMSFLKDFGDYQLKQSGSSMKICMIAEGSADFYPRFAPTHEWDTAAADAVLRGAGGVLAQFDGTPLKYCKEQTLNPNFIGANRKDPIFRKV